MSNVQEILNGPYSRLYERYGDPTEELQQAYDSWLADMASRPGSVLQPFEFDLVAHPEQSIYVPKIDAKTAYPNLPESLYYLGFAHKLSRSLGKIAAGKLLYQMYRHPASSTDPVRLPQRLNRNQEEGKNTIVVTSHINFQEMGYVRALRHITKRDRPYIDQCGVVVSGLFKRQSYKGEKVINQFLPMGNAYFSYPISASSDKHKVPDKANKLGNALFTKVMKHDLAKGGFEVDVALTGSEVKPEYNENDEFSHYRIPEIQPSSAKLVESFDEAVGITLVGPPILDAWHMHIGEVLDVKELLKSHSSAEVTDMIYADIREALERFTKKDVAYKKVARQIGNAALVVDAQSTNPL